MLKEFFDCVGSAFVDMCTGIAEDACQLGDELKHSSDSSYISPYQKKHDAEEKIAKSRVEFNNAQYKYQSYYKKVKSEIEQLNIKKLQILEGIDKSTNLSISSFSELEVDRPYFENRDDFYLGKFLGNIFGHNLMESAASSYLEDAKDYEVKMQEYCSKFEFQHAILNRIENKLEAERSLLETLESAVKRKTVQEQHKVAESIQKLLKYTICDSNGNINQTYINEINSLRSLI